MRSQAPWWHSREHSPLEPGVSARRWIGRLRLHAGKYILGITAPTGTGVQALPPGESSRKFFDSSYIARMLSRVRNSRRHHSPAHSRRILLKLFDADVAKPSWTEVQPWDILAACFYVRFYPKSGHSALRLKCFFTDDFGVPTDCGRARRTCRPAETSSSLSARLPGSCIFHPSSRI
jgi:hypothetical protein